ncbi:MAG: AsmA family protein, partial [Terriglobales bacterium]
MAARSKARRAGAILAVAGLAALLAPPFLNVNRFKDRLVSTMEAALGLQVAVDEVSLRLLPRPGFDLKNLVISDAPEFGAEPLLRAAEVRAALRLSSLWRGRMEIARLSLAAPSLNLVRSAEGRWNLESLLAHAAQTPVAPTGLVSAEVRPRFPYIAAEDGRINFKLGQEKKSFALNEAEFALWLESEGAWGLRLEGRPVRTDANLADTGTLRLRGTLGRAASLAETPIEINLELENARLGQLSRLVYGRDRGWRGALQLSLDFSGSLQELAIRASAELRDFRRLDLVGGTGLRAIAECTALYRARDEMVDAIECRMPTGAGEVSARGTIIGLFGDRRYDLIFTARDLPMSSLAELARRAKSDLPEDFSAAGAMSAAFTLRSLDDGATQWEGGGSIAGLRLRSGLLATELAPGEVKFAVESAGSQPGRPNKARPSETRLVVSPFPVALGATTAATAQAYFTAKEYSLGLRGETRLPELARVAASVGLPPPLAPAEGRAKVDLVISGPWAGFAAPVVSGA